MKRERAKETARRAVAESGKATRAEAGRAQEEEGGGMAGGGDAGGEGNGLRECLPVGDKELQVMEESEGLRRELASLRKREEENSMDAQLAATRLVDSLQVSQISGVSLVARITSWAQAIDARGFGPAGAACRGAGRGAKGGGLAPCRAAGCDGSQCPAQRKRDGEEAPDAANGDVRGQLRP